jgi:cytosine/adenosine deaminase-related metal-dependent hydrolase
MPRTLLVRNADVLVTMDDARRGIRNGGVLIEGGRIVAVEPSGELPVTANEVLDASRPRRHARPRPWPTAGA